MAKPGVNSSGRNLFFHKAHISRICSSAKQCCLIFDKRPVHPFGIPLGRTCTIHTFSVLALFIVFILGSIRLYGRYKEQYRLPRR